MRRTAMAVLSVIGVLAIAGPASAGIDTSIGASVAPIQVAVREPSPRAPATTQAPPTPAVPSYIIAPCREEYAEFLRQSGSASLAYSFAKISWRESGCHAVFVHDNDDWSYSSVGLNGITADLRRGWLNLCGADVRWDTRILSVDVKCALAAHRTMGFSPWSFVPSGFN